MGAATREGGSWNLLNGHVWFHNLPAVRVCGIISKIMCAPTGMQYPF